jgi:4-aminobutyrate aminotransferase-like enzyme
VARAVAVIETIQSKNLVEAARKNGSIILEKLRSKAIQLGLNPNSIQGTGLVFHLANLVDRLFPENSIANYEGRVTPLLTTEPNDLPAFRKD